MAYLLYAINYFLLISHLSLPILTSLFPFFTVVSSLSHHGISVVSSVWCDGRHGQGRPSCGGTPVRAETHQSRPVAGRPLLHNIRKLFGNASIARKLVISMSAPDLNGCYRSCGFVVCRWFVSFMTVNLGIGSWECPSSPN